MGRRRVIAVVVVVLLAAVGVFLGRALSDGGTDGRPLVVVLLALGGGLMGVVRARRARDEARRRGPGPR